MVPGSAIEDKTLAVGSDLRSSTSVAVDTIEDVFDPGSVSTAAVRLEPESPLPAGDDRSETLAALRERIRGMERRGLRDDGGLATRGIPTHPSLAALLPGGVMRAGAVYPVGPSAALTIAMLSAPSRAGLWTAVVGMPEFGIEAAHESGVRLDRLVLVPRPGEHWLSTIGVLAEVMGVIAVRAPRGAAPGALDRLTARLRQYGCALIVTGSPVAGMLAETVLAVERSRWRGIGRGHGFLADRELTVRASVGGGAPRRAVLHVPEPEPGAVVAAAVDAAAPSRRLEAVR
jgi:hypothetical protein